MYPQKMVNIKNVNKEVLKNPEIVKLVDEVRNNLPEDSLLLVRPSGTEPLVRVTISCKDILELDKYMELLVTKIQKSGEIVRMKNYALVLAAGKGTRMKTDIPKVAFPILRKTND